MTRVKGFDGLRAIAVLAVFGTHRTPLFRDSGIGHFGVMLFFALSGWLVCGILHDLRRDIENGTKSTATAAGSFFKRRALRILPIYYAVLTLFTFGALIGRTADHWHWSALPFQVAFLGNIPEMVHGWDVWGSHFWSLAIEAWFYFAAAPILLLLPRKRHVLALMLFAIAGYIQLALMNATGTPGVVIFVSFLPNFTALALGGAASIWLRDHRLSVPPFAGVLVLLAMMAITGNLVPGARVEWTSYLQALAATLIVISVALNQESLFTKTLEFAPLAYLGTISYGFYIIHDINHWSVKRLPMHGPWIDAAGNFLIALALAAASYHLFEDPVRRLGSNNSRTTKRIFSPRIGMIFP